MLASSTKNMGKKDPFDSDITAVAEKLMKDEKKKRPSTDELFAKAEAQGVDPFDILLQIADGNRMALNLDGDDDKPISPELRAMAARECLKYLYPTMKSAEITGAAGGPLDMSVKVVFEGEDEDAEPVNEGVK